MHWMEAHCMFWPFDATRRIVHRSIPNAAWQTAHPRHHLSLWLRNRNPLQLDK